MKKFLVMLLAVAMVLSMSVALASCGEDTPATSSEDAASTDSTAESSEASKEESTATSTGDETSEGTSEDITSEDITSEDITSEDVSVEDSSAAPAIEYKTSAAGTNYAKTATYTAVRSDAPETLPYLSYPDSTNWADVDCTKLNDGIVGDASKYDAATGALAGVSIQYAGTDKTFVFTFDLGDHYGDIKSLVFRQARHGTPNGNNRGFEVKLVRVSDDGINWTRAKGTLTSTQVANAVEITSKLVEGASNIEHFDFTYTLDAAAQGRYVEISLSNDGGYVLQFEELEIHN